MKNEVLGKWWNQETNGRFRCELCPRNCLLSAGQRGFCYVRMAKDDGIYLTSYGRSSGFCVDPIEKKPLYHFYPGSPILSFGTAGCNLGCKFCQNWDISKAKNDDRLQQLASPQAIVQACLDLKIPVVAFTYNDPIIFAEYAIDVAKICRAKGIKTVAVSSGYIQQGARPEFFEFLDAANIDLKSFSEEFYRKNCYGHLSPVLETLEYIKHQTNTWLEITTLLIPTQNDSPEEIKALCSWITNNLGCEVPLHFTAFFPSYKMLDLPATPLSTLEKSYQIAKSAGLKYVYLGNVAHSDQENTHCPNCQRTVVERNVYNIESFDIVASKCRFCHSPISGHFSDHAGDWGGRRKHIDISRGVKNTGAATIEPFT